MLGWNRAAKENICQLSFTSLITMEYIKPRPSLAGVRRATTFPKSGVLAVAQRPSPLLNVSQTPHQESR